MKNMIFIFMSVLATVLIPIQVWADNSPILTIQPAPEYDYVFGFVEPGKVAEKEMHIINTGQGILSGSVTLENPKQETTGEEEKVFFLSGDTNFSLFENQSAVVKIQFVPIKAKEYQGKIKVVASENQSAEITLKGVGKKPPKDYYLLGCGSVQKKNNLYHIDIVIVLFLIIFLCRRDWKSILIHI